MLCCPIFLSSVSCSTSRACLRVSLERNVNRRHIFLRTRGKRIAWVLQFNRIRMNNDHTAHRSRIKFFDIVKTHVTLTGVPGFEWIVLREDCLARRTPSGPEGDRCVLKGSTSSQEAACLHSDRLIKVQCASENFESCPFAPLL